MKQFKMIALVAILILIVYFIFSNDKHSQTEQHRKQLPTPAVKGSVMSPRKDDLRNDSVREPIEPEVYDLPQTQQDLINIEGIGLDGNISPKIQDILKITQAELNQLKVGMQSLADKVAEWESEHAEIVDGTGIIKLNPSGDFGRSVKVEYGKLFETILNQKRGSFLAAKSKNYTDMITGGSGVCAKVMRISLRRDANGQVLTDKPYEIEEKNLRNTELLRTIDWLDPKNFKDDSISNLFRSLYFKEIPQRYAHLIAPSNQNGAP